MENQPAPIVPTQSPQGKGNPLVIVLSILVIILLSSTVYLYLQNQQLKNQLSVSSKVVSSTPYPSVTPTTSNNVPVDSLVRYSITNNLDNNLYLIFSKDTLVEKNVITQNGNKYKINTFVGPGICSMDSTAESCSYYEESDTKWQFYRIWTKFGKIFAINPQIFSLDNVESKGLIVTKISPTEFFSKTEMNLWKSILNNVVIGKDTSEQTSNASYHCPENGWVDCMPILTGEKKVACSPEAMAWYKNNCPNFQGGAL